MAWCWGRHRPASYRRCQVAIGQVLTDQTTANTAQGDLLALAEANLAIAQDAATRNALTSPIAGTVAAISIAAGDTVAASSTSAVVTVIGDDGFVVTTTVPLSSIETVEVGARAEVTAASTPEAQVGAVSSIGCLCRALPCMSMVRRRPSRCSALAPYETSPSRSARSAAS